MTEINTAWVKEAKESYIVWLNEGKLKMGDPFFFHQDRNGMMFAGVLWHGPRELVQKKIKEWRSNNV